MDQLDYKRTAIFNVFSGVKGDNYEGVVNVLEEMERRGRVEGQASGFAEGLQVGALLGAITGALFMGLAWWLAG
jgi:hypothetical protein